MKLLSTALLLLGSHQGYKQAVVATSFPTNDPIVVLKFGPGYCADSVGNFYSSAQARNVGSSAEDCSVWCLQNTNNLLGFSYSSSRQRCFCEFDGGELPSPPPEYTNPLATNLQSLSGTGPIQGTISSGASYECYTYLDSTNSPSGSPTSKPTSTNSPTAMPSSTVITPSDTCGTCPLVGQKYIPTFGCEVFYDCEYRVLHRCPAGLLFDVDAQLCNFPSAFTCTCAEATALTPTSNPTANPYLSPTVSPSASPLTNPTETPSSSPSSSPSKSPISVKPTAEPSQSPPSASPSTNPTQAPSLSSSSSPSNKPTDSPTHMPTKVPTLSPVFEPEDPRLRSSPPVTVGPTTTAPSSQPLTSGPTGSYSGKASKNAKNAKVTDESSKSSKSNGKSSKSESYVRKSSKSNFTNSKSLKENFVQGYSLRY